mgnify:CR=1 FL=1
MEIEWVLLFGAVLNFFLLVGLIGLVVSYVKKPDIFLTLRTQARYP